MNFLALLVALFATFTVSIFLQFLCVDKQISYLVLLLRPRQLQPRGDGDRRQEGQGGQDGGLRGGQDQLHQPAQAAAGSHCKV